MRNFLCCLAAFSFLSTQTAAQSSEQMLKTEVLAAHVSGLLSEADLILQRSIDLILKNNAPDRIIQADLEQFVDSVDGIRAIIFIDRGGNLIHDSSRFPTIKMNLSSREYFSKTITASESDLVVAAPVLGKQSNIPFIPIARVAKDKDRKVFGIAVAISQPQSWLNGANCSDCIVSIFNSSGQSLAANPSGTEELGGLFEKVDLNESSGAFLANVGVYPTVNVWKKITGHEDVIVLTTERLPD